MILSNNIIPTVPVLKMVRISKQCKIAFAFKRSRHKVRNPYINTEASQVVTNLPANAGDVRDAVSKPKSGRSPGVGDGNPLQYSCLENSVDKGGWQARVHGSV